MPEACCLECHCKITIAPSGIEYGHSAGHKERPRCSRRESVVDSADPRRNHGRGQADA